MTGEIFLLELQAHTGQAVTTLRYSSDTGYTTGASDTPANTAFLPRIIQPGNFKVSAFEQGRTFGASQVGYGEIVLDNKDGALDALIDYGFDGRQAVLRVGIPGAAYPAGFTTIYTATVEQPVFDWETVTLRLRDRQAELAVNIPLSLFAGTNSLPNGLEGTASDLKGKLKPLVLGTVFNISPPCCNTSKLIYAVSPPFTGSSDLVTDWDAITDFDAVSDFFGTITRGISSVTVYDRGVALTAGADYTDEADMLANAPAAGAYRVLKSDGYIRLGSAPAGQVTVDCSDNSGVTPTAGNLIKAVLEKYRSWTTADYSAADLTALDAAIGDSLGIYVDSQEQVSSVLDKICNSVGACYAFDQAGVFRVFRITVPSGTEDLSLTDSQIYAVSRRSTADTGNGVPAWQVKLRYQRNSTVQTSDLAGAVTADRRAFLAQEWRETVVSNSTIKTVHPLATELDFDTYLTTENVSEANRRLTIYQTRRDRLDLQLKRDDIDFATIRIGNLVRLNMSGRYGYTNKLMLMTGIATDLARGRITLTIWG